MGNRLYVGNLSYSTNEAALRDLFAKCGEVVSAQVVKIGRASCRERV